MNLETNTLKSSPVFLPCFLILGRGRLASPLGSLGMCPCSFQDVADYKSKGKFDGAKGPAKVARKKVEEEDEDEDEEEEEEEEEEDE